MLTRKCAAESDLQLSTSRRTFVVKFTNHLPWAREVPFQMVYSVSRFLSLSNNLGIWSSLGGQPHWPFQIGF
jgi:hypothetical protein